MPLLYLIARHSLLRAYVEASARIQGLPAAETSEQMLVDVVGQTSTPWRQLAATLAPPYVPDVGTALAAHIALDEDPLRELREALQALRNLDVPALELLLTESLGLCGHRLDAWITSIAHKRLSLLRQEDLDGTHIGGFGWVEASGRARPGCPSAPRRPARAPESFVHPETPATSTLPRSGTRRRRPSCGAAT